jgi:protein-S-isoprenylcysteine O-methyltransferase Ste14
MAEAGTGMASAPAGALTIRLARLRVPLGFAFGALALYLAAPTARTLAAGGAVACVGEAIRIWAAGHLNKAREVTMSGPYRWAAHPLYVGSSVMGAGLAIAAGSLLVAALVAAYLVVTLTAAIRSEEALLRQRFGDEYDRYRGAASREATGAGKGRRFSVRQALANREPRAVAGLLAAWLLLTWKATYNGTFWQPGG